MAKQDDWTKITLRLPPELHRRLTGAAGSKSLNAEIVDRLDRTLTDDWLNDRATETYHSLELIRDGVIDADDVEDTPPRPGADAGEVVPRLEKLLAFIVEEAATKAARHAAQEVVRRARPWLAGKPDGGSIAKHLDPAPEGPSRRAPSAGGKQRKR